MNGHVPVMLSKVVEILAPHDGAHYVDGTFGAGGYTRAILQAADCSVLAVDRDPQAISYGQTLVHSFGGRLHLVQAQFSRMDSFVAATDGVVLDLGVSSFQLDEPERGFSFRQDGPLDMRMNGQGQSAGDLLASVDESTLAQIISRYGEEKNARRIARAIIAARPIKGTAHLAKIISDSQGRKARRYDIHPATRTFQALRIYVNDELGELERGLAAAQKILKSQGRLVVVSFHSLEDGIVKRFFAQRSSSAPRQSRHAPVRKSEPAVFQLLTKGAFTPSAAEIQANPRARSAKLRAGLKLAA